jgi:hypothetical protein
MLSPLIPYPTPIAQYAFHLGHGDHGEETTEEQKTGKK